MSTTQHKIAKAFRKSLIARQLEEWRHGLVTHPISPKLASWHKVVMKKGRQKHTVRFCEEHCNRHDWHNAGCNFYFKDQEIAVLFKMTFPVAADG